jgi:hypothetical protein
MVNNSTNINKANNHLSSLNYRLSFDFTGTSVCYMFLKNLFIILSSIINKIKKI